MTALRSFRGAESRALIGLGQPQAGLAFGLEHETFGASRVTITLRPDGREVLWEQGKVTRLADFIGRFPTVAFWSQDNQFLRGSPSLRRRWLDLTLVLDDPASLVAPLVVTKRWVKASAARIARHACDVLSAGLGGVLAEYLDPAIIEARRK